MNKLPLIVDIKRHSLEDGPGIRSVVFLKGCPLSCIFCQNIETQNPDVEIAFSSRDCIRCGSCANACPQGAIDLEFPARIHREMCSRCGKCVDVCPGKALRLIGDYYSIEVLTEVLLRDLPFYRHSGGGVTFSGGEPMLYPDYLEPLLKQLTKREIHLALETSGYFDYKAFNQKILPYIKHIYYDIKIADPELHRVYTGKTNRKIFDNLHRLFREKDVVVHPRVPLVPNITTSKENLSAIVDILCEAGARDITLLPYNPLGIEKAVDLGLSKPPLNEAFMNHDEEKEVYDIFKALIEEKVKG